MPFDVASFSTKSQEDDAFLDLGFIPIAEERAEKWRQHVLNLFAAKGGYQSRQVARGMAAWRSRSTSIQSLNKHNDYFAPKDVRRLIAEIARAVPNATAEIEYFDKDPILYVRYRGRRHCMAIWDKSIVRAMAGNVALSGWQKILGRLVVTV